MKFQCFFLCLLLFLPLTSKADSIQDRKAASDILLYTYHIDIDPWKHTLVEMQAMIEAAEKKSARNETQQLVHSSAPVVSQPPLQVQPKVVPQTRFAAPEKDLVYAPTVTPAYAAPTVLNTGNRLSLWMTILAGLPAFMLLNLVNFWISKRRKSSMPPPLPTNK